MPVVYCPPGYRVMPERPSTAVPSSRASRGPCARPQPASGARPGSARPSGRAASFMAPNPRERGRFGPATIAPTRHRPGVLELPGATVPTGSVPAGFASSARRPLEQRPKTASGVVLGQYKWATSHDSDFQNWVGRHENLMYDPNWTPAMRTEPNLAQRDSEMMKLEPRAINRLLAERCARNPPVPFGPDQANACRSLPPQDALFERLLRRQG